MQSEAEDSSRFLRRTASRREPLYIPKPTRDWLGIAYAFAAAFLSAFMWVGIIGGIVAVFSLVTR